MLRPSSAQVCTETKDYSDMKGNELLYRVPLYLTPHFSDPPGNRDGDALVL